MTVQTSFRSTWDRMDCPLSSDDLTIRELENTNAYLTKSFDGSMGLFLRDIRDSLPNRKYKNLEITTHTRQDLHRPDGEIEILRNCLKIVADPAIKAQTLSLILERLHDHQPSGHFTATDMVTVLDEVEELLRRPKGLPPIEEVAGAWGELYVLRMLIQNTSDARRQYSILSGWEGEHQEKIDFRFLFAAQALEIKTTMSDKRIHHMHGSEQVVIPPAFNFGALASLRISPSEGVTCAALLDDIVDAYVGTSDEERKRFAELLHRRTRVRGKESTDDRFSFNLVRDGLAFYDFSVIPSPGDVEGVIAIEWLSDLRGSEPLSSDERDSLISRITRHQQAS